MAEPGTSEFSRLSIGAAIAAAVGAAVTVGPMIVPTFGIFMVAFGKAFGWTRTEFSSVILVTAWIGAIVTPFAGRLIDRFGVRRVMLPGVALFGLALMSVSLVRGKLWELYAFYALVGLTAGVQNAVPYSKLVSLWFQRHRGAVLACVTTAYGISYAIMPQVVRPLIASHGWQSGYIFLGGLTIASLLVLIPLLHAPPSTSAIHLGNEGAAGVTLAEAVRTPAFWMIGVTIFLAVDALVGTLAHAFPMITDRGLSPKLAADVISTVALGSMVGQISFGFVLDRSNSPQVGALYFASALIGASLIHYGAAASALVPGGFMMGVGQGAELGLAAYFVTRYFGTRHFGEIYGWLYAGATVASGLGPLLMGLAFDRLGSYRPMEIAAEISLALAVICVACLPAYRFAAGRSTPPAGTAALAEAE
jgi:MFS family permease